MSLLQLTKSYDYFYEFGGSLRLFHSTMPLYCHFLVITGFALPNDRFSNILILEICVTYVYVLKEFFPSNIDLIERFSVLLPLLLMNLYASMPAFSRAGISPKLVLPYIIYILDNNI